MVRFYPVRGDQTDDGIRSFPLTIPSHRGGQLFWLKPQDGTPVPASWTRAEAYDQEKTTPYYYSTRFDEGLIQTEFTPTERCGYFRFTIPSGKPTVLLANRFPGEILSQGKTVVTGVERFQKMQAFFYGEFNSPVVFKAGSVKHKGRMTASAEGGNVLEFRYGISFISIDQARLNLTKEIPEWGFELVMNRAKDRWSRELGRVKVEGGTESQRRVFYTALYRSYERMVNITEDGRYYSAYDHKVHEDPRPFYVDNWLWDTFRALEPLHTLLNPEMEADKIQSYVRMYEQSAWMPSFALLAGDFPCMNGNHAAAWMADAWFKGVRNFDLNTAYQGLRKNSLEATLLPWRNGPKCALDDFYNKHGYFPALPPGAVETEPKVSPREKRQPVAVTLENSYDDWCIAQLAGAVDKPADHLLFLKRAANYKKVFCEDKGFMWPKDAKGKWIEPFDPKFGGGSGGREYFDENNAFTYSWYVPHDYCGLFKLMGGTGKAGEKLDQLFREPLKRGKSVFWHQFPDSTGLVGQFSMGNEPSFSIPYLYNRLGAPWKTQKRIRMLLETFFTDTLLGIPGDEDGGGMSAFVVFSMMGFYPVTPGVPAYDIGSPVFDKVSIALSNGKTFSIVAHDNSRDNKYVQSLVLNGKPLNRIWFAHADIVNGGILEIQMGNTPNKSLGADPSDYPPAAMEVDPGKPLLLEK
jgi:predicted alpha-1,2-mannosidase